MYGKRDHWSIFWLVLVIFAIWAISTLTSCATAGGGSSSAPTAPKYELTLAGTIDGVPFQGVSVGSSATSHDIAIQSAVDINMFTIKSCHRSQKAEDVISTGWFKANRGYSFQYNEAPTIEDTGDCVLRLCAFSKQVGAVPSSCAVIDFKSPRYVLPAENICNGADGMSTGTNMCHTQVGLIERIRFKGPVVVSPLQIDVGSEKAPYLITGQCAGKFIDQDATLWEYAVPENECVTIFMEKAKPHRRAKLTVVPYDLPQYSGGG